MSEKQADNNRIRVILVILIFAAVLGGFFALNRIITPPEISQSERRPLAKFPELTAKSFVSASCMADIETWAADSFALREPLRTLHAETIFHVFMQSDKDGLYIGDSGAGKFEKINEKNWTGTLGKINTMNRYLSDGTLADGGFHVYTAVIPDKSIYAGKYLPGYDQGAAKRLLAERLDTNIKGIDLTDALTSTSFYKTDLHWSQPNTYGVMQALGDAMGFDALASKKTADAYIEDAIAEAGSFKGAYAGQIALPMAPDRLYYMSNPYINSAAASYLDPKTQTMRLGKVYYPEALSDGGDPYDFFLNGPQPLVVLETQEPADGRTLYLFRDSFGSSLAPLFLRAYDRVVLIDLRYIDSRILSAFVDIEPGADILFLYSSQVMNHPDILLVS